MNSYTAPTDMALALTPTPSWRPKGALDWLFALWVVACAAVAFWRYHGAMDVYEQGILIGSVPVAIAMGWFWRPLAYLMLGVAALSLVGIGLYQGPEGADLARAEQVFWLKYFLSSQSAILWMSVLIFMSTVFYWLGMVLPRADSASLLGARLAWAAVLLALVGTMMRWYESHQMGEGVGHIPVSNLYEVFVLFAWMTTLFYLYYEQYYQTRGMGPFAMLIVSGSVGFLLWYTLVRDAQTIQPLLPALQSWWMKLHVPANFVGYGTFSIAAMVGFAYLVKQSAQQTHWIKLAPLALLGAVLAFVPLAFRQQALNYGSVYWMVYSGVALLVVAGILYGRRRIAERLPSLEVLDDTMYKAIAVGFAFFTIATVLGALWAAEAWGGYWSWDPKETWALIVWLNYAAWLHLRLMKGLRGAVAAWWSLAGLGITTFAFLGVNMFLSGLHSYGSL